MNFNQSEKTILRLMLSSLTILLFVAAVGAVISSFIYLFFAPLLKGIIVFACSVFLAGLCRQCMRLISMVQRRQGLD